MGRRVMSELGSRLVHAKEFFELGFVDDRDADGY
jgi:hypothetical protein